MQKQVVHQQGVMKGHDTAYRLCHACAILICYRVTRIFVLY